MIAGTSAEYYQALTIQQALSVLQVLSHLIFLPCEKYCEFPHFTDEKTELINPKFTGVVGGRVRLNAKRASLLST